MTPSPRLTRYLVLAPTMMLSLALGNLGFAPLPRLGACLSLAAVLITGLTLYRHRQSRWPAIDSATSARGVQVRA
jgi:hypothetical protein